MFYLLKLDFYWSEECTTIKVVARKVSDYECYTIIIDGDVAEENADSRKVQKKNI